MKAVVESVRIVIQTEEGNRFEVNGKGSATAGMRTAFLALAPKRRGAFLESLQKLQAELVAKEQLDAANS